MYPFERLQVWVRAHAVAVSLHADTSGWGDRDLRSQIRRCALSVPANIAEGAGSESSGQFARYLTFAQASASELRYHLRFAADVGLLAPARYTELDAATQEVRAMLVGLTRRVRERAAAELAQRKQTRASRTKPETRE